MFSGTPKMQGIRWEMVHPKVAFLADDEDVPTGRILPVYALTEGINQVTMRRIVHGVVDAHVGLVDDVFPEPLLERAPALADPRWPSRRFISRKRTRRCSKRGGG